MARTYLQLRDRVLTFCDQVGSDDAAELVEAALEESMKYITSKIELPGLLHSAQATWGSSTTSLSIVTDFGVADYASPDRLYVKKDSTADNYGLPYDYVEWMHWHDLKSVPSGDIRDSIFSPASLDERPARAWTIENNDLIHISPYATDNVLSLFYFSEPAAYSDAGTPEIPAKWDYILVSGGVLILKEWLREGDLVVEPRTILKGLDEQIAEMDSELSGKRKRGNLKISHRYRIY